MYMILEPCISTYAWYSVILPGPAHIAGPVGQAVYVTERLLDIAADKIGIDPVEIRQRNYIAEEKMPYTTLIPTVYDSGDFSGITTHAAEVADIAGFEERKKRVQRVESFVELGRVHLSILRLHLMTEWRSASTPLAP